MLRTVAMRYFSGAWPSVATWVRNASSRILPRQLRAKPMKNATMQAGAGPADVERMLALLADSLVYEHPRARASIVGRTAFGDGVRGFLGKTRKAEIRITGTLVTGAVVATRQEITFEAEREGHWYPDGRTQLTIFDIEDGRIARIVDFWQPSR